MQFLFKNNRLSYIFIGFSGLFYAAFAYDLERTDFVKLIMLVAALFYFMLKIISLNKNNEKLLFYCGIAFRLIFFMALPNLSQDFYRFIWDGHLMAQGFNPYLQTPDEIMASGQISIPNAALLHEKMGGLSAGHFSNYPPVNQLLFAIASWFGGSSLLTSVMVLRLQIILADIGIFYFGRKLLAHFTLPTTHIFWYFLNPFTLIEFTGNLHFEGVMLFFLIVSVYLLAKGKWAWASLPWAFSILIKLVPLMLLPLLLRKLGFWKMAGFCMLVLGTATLFIMPFASQAFVQNYSATIGLWFQKFEFNASIYYIIREIGFAVKGYNIIQQVGKVMPFIVVFVMVVVALFRRNEKWQVLIHSMLFCLMFYLLTATTVHPWYVATPLLLSVFTRFRFVVFWSFTVFLSYAAYGNEAFKENLWLVALEYVAVVAFFAWELIKKKPSLAA